MYCQLYVQDACACVFLVQLFIFYFSACGHSSFHLVYECIESNNPVGQDAYLRICNEV